jgi:hypothetical protein
MERVAGWSKGCKVIVAGEGVKEDPGARGALGCDWRTGRAQVGTDGSNLLVGVRASRTEANFCRYLLYTQYKNP